MPSRSAYASHTQDILDLASEEGHGISTSNFPQWHLRALAYAIADVSEKNLDIPGLPVLGIRAISECMFDGDSRYELVSLICSVIAKHPTEVLVQLEGCVALRLLCRSDPDGFAEAVRCDGILLVEHLLTVLAVHWRSKELRLLCLDLMNVLAAYSCEMMRLIACKKQGTAFILELLDREMTDNHLQEVGMALLSLVAEDEIGRCAINEENGIERILRIMKHQLENHFVQCNATAVLSWLIHSGENVQNFSVNGSECIDTVMKLISKYIEDPSIFGTFTRHEGQCF
jgi:hypothetical protein